MPTYNKSEILNTLREYQTLAFRIALRREHEEGEWMLHTLLLDAIPDTYYHDKAVFTARYHQEGFCHVYPVAAFIAGVRESSDIISWFDESQEFEVSAPVTPTSLSRVFTTQIPEVQDTALFQNYFYRTEQIDGFDKMLWPHTVYKFPKTQYVQETYDDTPLIGTKAAGSRSFPNFKIALYDLIYGQKDWEKSQNWSTDRSVVIRLVRDEPYFADIKQIDVRHIEANVHGRSMAETVVQIMATGGLSEEIPAPLPDTYQLELASDLPQTGRISLIHAGKVLDECHWDRRYNPLPGAAVGTSQPAQFPQRSALGDPIDLPTYLQPSTILPSQTQLLLDDAPLAIQESLAKFKKDHAVESKTAFIMMHFGSSEAHETITKTIKDALAKYGLEVVYLEHSTLLACPAAGHWQ